MFLFYCIIIASTLQYVWEGGRKGKVAGKGRGGRERALLGTISITARLTEMLDRPGVITVIGDAATVRVREVGTGNSEQVGWFLFCSMLSREPSR